MKRTKAISLIILALSLVVTADLGYNFFSCLVPALNDGIAIHGIVARLIFGDGPWTAAGYLKAFSVSMWITVIVALENIVVSIVRNRK